MCVARQFQLVTYKLNVIHHNFGRDFLRRSLEHINSAINNVNEGAQFLREFVKLKILSMRAGTAYRVSVATANAQSYRQMKPLKGHNKTLFISREDF